MRDGYVSVTPLQADLTAYDALADVENLTIEQEPAVAQDTRGGGAPREKIKTLE